MTTLGGFFGSFFEKVKNIDMSSALGEIGSGILKIPLEGKYDDLGKTELIKSLKSSGPLKKYPAVGGLLVLSAFLGQIIPENSPFWLALNRLAGDAGPEIGKRIINGDKSPVVEDPEKYASQVENPTEKSILRMLCHQKAETFAGFWTWYFQPDQEKRRMILAQMREHGFTEEEIQNIPSLNPENLRRLFEDFQPKEKEPKINSPKRITFLDAVERRLRQHRDSLAQKNGGSEHGKS